MCRSDLMKRRWMTCRSLACIYVLTVLTDRVDNFKRMNMKLLTSKLSKIGFKWKVCTRFTNFQVALGNDNVRIALMKSRKWATQSTPIVQPSSKNRFALRGFTHKGSSMSSYEGFTTLPSRSRDQNGFKTSQNSSFFSLFVLFYIYVYKYRKKVWDA